MTYDRVTKSMWEAANCVSVRLFSAAPSLASSKEVRGREKGQALPQLLCACWTEDSFYLRLLQPMSLRNPHGSPEGLEANSPPTPREMAVEAGTCTAPLTWTTSATSLLEYICCATASLKNHTLGHKTMGDRETTEN